MKKAMFLTLIAAALFGNVRAQHAEFGIKGGLNVASLHSSETSAYDARVSGNFGVLAHIHLSRVFAVQPEVMYSSQGATYDVGNEEHTISLGYINIPLMGQLMLGDGFRIQTGPQFGFLTSAKRKNGTVVDIKDDLSSVDLSWIFGISYITPSRFGFDARYNLGLNDLNDDGSGTLKNRVFQAGVFYQFRH